LRHYVCPGMLGQVRPAGGRQEATDLTSWI
jgi:hypothetical protein